MATLKTRKSPSDILKKNNDDFKGVDLFYWSYFDPILLHGFFAQAHMITTWDILRET